MACVHLQSGSDAFQEFFVPSRALLHEHHRMKQSLTRLSLGCIQCRVPIHVLHGKSMSCQTAAMEMETISNDTGDTSLQGIRWKDYETKVLIEAIAWREVQKLKPPEAAEDGHNAMKSNWKRIERFCRERGVYRDSEQCRNRWNWLNVIYSRIHSWEEREQSCFWSMKVDEKRANGFGRFKMNRYMYDLINELKNGNINQENIESIFKDSGDENSKKISDTVDDPKEMQLGHNTRIESEAEQISIGLCFKNKLENRNGDYENTQSLLAEDRDECFSGFSSDTAALKAVVHIDSTKDANTPNVYQASSEVEAQTCGKGELHGQGSQICEVAVQSKNSSTSIMQIEHSQSVNDCNESLNVSMKGTNMQVKLVDEMDQITESRINIKEQLSGEDDGTRLEMSTAECTDHCNEARVLKAGGSIEGRDVVASDSRKLDDDLVMYVPVAIGNTLKSISQAFKKYFKF